ncbi:CUT1 family carbohydrate ABC transporter membrane protein [Leptolyngbya boryana NIES-2135]|uniref:CUT1 family carbohydrate ABC transporter membrane protein n=1 Tax=Leptolyngbya boryana NIES-2135 TaxID=1973484 RepID=A0A1Z4JQ04_LEPBY|nr:MULTISPECIES: sugar ABC transporter permease [Leptolyngbya]BAY58841.1 CUT1 family carbohydrate ABC transporter membrane protein [Leptolyngbya boryana NIES-2135]MBD2370417.1 sugar ABC transporter permease [Leptolyngbya sp. FACHB-161]MBD2376904.1 sugar ABC transporter permease [Leptolyngbya sp. FACHB-238]MBD2401271.1 sugar ABC transporter permease [Leptolyngbya sp. FACHB-239]MBD2407822.1 sugar ABC transporter permease [Leptolyngbya sp. FACHB-402]
MTPTIIILGVFLMLPVIYAIVLAFYKVQLLGEVNYNFTGLKNFIRIQDDERVRIALLNTIQYVLIVVPIQTILALILALLLNAKIRGKSWFRVAFFLPTVTSSAVLTLIFMWIYNSNGLLNGFLSAIGLPTYNWLGDPQVALKGIMLMNIWATAPLFMVIYLAALQDIPESLYEAASIDGATAWEKFWCITLPFLKPVTFFVITMGIIGTFQLFDQSYIFSNGSGGPDNATLTIVLLIYQYAFKSLDMGYALALTLILALVIMTATLIQRALFKEERLDS